MHSIPIVIKKICVLQFHYTDLMPLIKDHNCIDKLKKSGIFDHIVLAAADIKENECLKEYAEIWDVDLHYGSVEDVHQRIESVINLYDADIILRVLPQWYFLDVNLIEEMIDFLVEYKADYLSLKNNFDIRFAGDLFTKSLFDEIKEIFSQNDDYKTKFRFNPWGFVDIHGELLDSKIVEFDNVPTYPAIDFSKFKETYNLVWPEHWDKTDTPMFPYDLASKFLKKDSKMKVLDIACGFGTGSAHLKNSGASEVTGVDISEDAITHCQDKYSNIDNLKFFSGDALGLEFKKESFDLIVTIHTMEHVIDDKSFLHRLYSWLKTDSRIVLEVPLLMKYPFAESSEPYGDAHIREYDTNELLRLFSNYFEIIKAYGVCRGFYTDTANARNAVLVVGRKPSHAQVSQN